MCVFNSLFDYLDVTNYALKQTTQVMNFTSRIRNPRA